MAYASEGAVTECCPLFYHPRYLYGSRSYYEDGFVDMLSPLLIVAASIGFVGTRKQISRLQA